MPRKFISFLGSAVYQPMEYFFNQDENELATPTPYVQEAIIEKAIDTWDADDEILIFTTIDANHKNYKNRIVFNPYPKTELLEGQGLESVLNRLQQEGKIGKFRAVHIEDGTSEQEIWAVFQTVFSELTKEDELYFDITYGFRSLPMLGMVLLDYAQTIHNIKISKIFYGNFEARKPSKTQSNKMIAPVLDLTAFAELQSWTAASRAFLKGGNAEQLADLCALHNPAISDNLRQFAPAILTCRGTKLHRDLDISSFKNLVDSTLNSSITAQLRPLLGKVQEKLAPFESNNVLNGLHAVQWCIDNGLIQQGFTFLQETIVSLVIERTLSSDFVTDVDYRNDVSSAVGNYSYSPRIKKLSKTTYSRLLDYVSVREPLTEVYKRLTGKRGFRNDINHCGFRENYADPLNLKKELLNLYNQIKDIAFPYEDLTK